MEKIDIKAALVRIFMPWRTVGISGKGWRHNLLFLFTNVKSPHKAAQSFSMGVFIGLLPILGFQTLTWMVLTPLLKLNWPLAFLGVNISFPPMLPLIIATAIAVGKIFVPMAPISLPAFFRVHPLARYGVEWFFGSIVLAIAVGIFAYAITYLVYRKMVIKTER